MGSYSFAVGRYNHSITNAVTIAYLVLKESYDFYKVKRFSISFSFHKNQSELRTTNVYELFI